ncbi:MAG: CrcB family protein [Propionibacteriaceae bacterium]|nr:CrcB family protein [Micropruina sp.]HBX82933.1 camphor resistance protein CrcB [Propionibacteriaceae bacterium]HBY24079.1 camphor resistance protein CrcB [Propionibacteriaceae bacterium]
MIQLFVALAGGLGATVRFIIDAQVRRFTATALIPLGTVFINITGSFALGIVTGWWAIHTGDPGLKQILGTGFLGGYTTFSTASVEAARLARAGRGWSVMVHVVGMLVLSVTAAAIGVWLGARP